MRLKTVNIALVPTAGRDPPNAPELPAGAQSQGTAATFPSSFRAGWGPAHRIPPRHPALPGVPQTSTQPGAHGVPTGPCSSREGRGRDRGGGRALREKEAAGPRGNERTGSCRGERGQVRTKARAARGRKSWCGKESAPAAEHRPERAPRLSQPSGLHRPLFPGSRGPTPLPPGEAPGPPSAPAGPSGPRLPRPRLPPARPRARSPAHVARRGPRLPGCGCPAAVARLRLPDGAGTAAPAIRLGF